MIRQAQILNCVSHDGGHKLIKLTIAVLFMHILINLIKHLTRQI